MVVESCEDRKRGGKSQREGVMFECVTFNVEDVAKFVTKRLFRPMVHVVKML